MKLLHILKSEPDANTKTLIAILSEGNEAIEFPLYGAQVNYEALVDTIFSNDKVISWW
ncbi:MAG: hypothetical protein QG552_1825 [Thermodesulfobacteriota bacterium]|nr:hypothetical protein [Thermodesulfobacteriota bacterium]